MADWPFTSILLSDFITILVTINNNNNNNNNNNSNDNRPLYNKATYVSSTFCRKFLNSAAESRPSLFLSNVFTNLVARSSGYWSSSLRIFTASSIVINSSPLERVIIINVQSFDYSNDEQMKYRLNKALIIFPEN